MSKFALFASFILVAQGAPKTTTKPNGPMDTCQHQADCMQLTVTPQYPVPLSCNANADQNCLYQVCLSFDYSRSNCVKTGAISHTCQKDSGVCKSPATFEGAKEVGNWGVGTVQCQTALGGSKIQFLLKDGNGCSNGPSVSGWSDNIKGTSGAVVNCAPRADPTGSTAWNAVKSCTGNGVGVECIWEVQLPACPAPPAQNPPTTGTTTPPIGTQMTCNCQNGGTCDTASGCCYNCNTGYSGCNCDTLQCDSIMGNYPDMKILNSGIGPVCTLDEASADLGPYDCHRETQGCNVLKCNKPVPAQLMADIQAKCTSYVV